MEEALIVFIVFASMTAVIIVIGLFIYFGKRLEHKQILAAIEKGIPPAELRLPKHKLAGPTWIKHITSGIIVLAIAFAFVFAELPGLRGEEFFVAVILCGVGIAYVIRGLLYRKYQPQIQSSDKSKIEKDENS